MTRTVWSNLICALAVACFAVALRIATGHDVADGHNFDAWVAAGGGLFALSFLVVR